MTLKDFLQRRMDRSRRIKDRQEEIRTEQIVQNRMKSPQEREVLNWIEKERQNELKEQVKLIRAKDTRDFFSTGIIDTTNIFKYHPRVMDMQTRALERSGFFI